MSDSHFVRLKDLMTRSMIRANLQAKEFGTGFESVDEIYRKRMIVNADRVKDINTRFRWDMFHRAMKTDKFQLQDELYEYLNDDHIDTALKKIVADIE